MFAFVCQPCDGDLPRGNYEQKIVVHYYILHCNIACFMRSIQLNTCLFSKSSMKQMSDNLYVPLQIYIKDGYWRK